jgi:hypothetical protein
VALVELDAPTTQKSMVPVEHERRRRRGWDMETLAALLGLDPRAPRVTISDIRWDGPENDVVFGDSEYVELSNTGTGPAEVGGWTVGDEADHVIRIPDRYLIPAGGTLRLYSGPGDDTDEAYFAGFGQAIWNNSGGDTATLRDRSGIVIDSFSYSSRGAGRLRGDRVTHSTVVSTGTPTRRHSTKVAAICVTTMVPASAATDR